MTTTVVDTLPHLRVLRYLKSLEDGPCKLERLQDKTKKILQEHAESLNESIPLLLKSLKEVPLHSMLLEKKIPLKPYSAFVERTCAIKLGTVSKVISVSSPPLLLAAKDDRNDVWNIGHLSANNQKRLVAFLDTSEIPEDLSEEDWLILAKQAHILNLPKLFNSLMKQKNDSFPSGHKEIKNLYILIIKQFQGVIQLSTLDSPFRLLRTKCEAKLIEKWTVEGVPESERDLCKHIHTFTLPLGQSIIANSDVLTLCCESVRVIANYLVQEDIDIISERSNCIDLVTNGGTFESIPKTLARRLKALSIHNCSMLEALDLPEVTTLICTECYALTTVNIPLETEAVFSDCIALKT